MQASYEDGLTLDAAVRRATGEDRASGTLFLAWLFAVAVMGGLTYWARAAQLERWHDALAVASFWHVEWSPWGLGLLAVGLFVSAIVKAPFALQDKGIVAAATLPFAFLFELAAVAPYYGITPTQITRHFVEPWKPDVVVPLAGLPIVARGCDYISQRHGHEDRVIFRVRHPALGPAGEFNLGEDVWRGNIRRWTDVMQGFAEGQLPPSTTIPDQTCINDLTWGLDPADATTFRRLVG